ncbi:MAG: sigma 54-interacting transcriptional regulator [Magnetococcales bacterium]|nr:sigma 54-interacting transcriptional regulator [Magnetococcales bacterium]
MNMPDGNALFDKRQSLYVDLDDLMQLVEEAMIVLNYDGMIIANNILSCELLKIDRAENGISLRDIQPVLYDRMMDYVKKMQIGNKKISRSIERLFIDNTQRIVSCGIIHAQDYLGRPSGIVVMMREITQRTTELHESQETCQQDTCAFASSELPQYSKPYIGPVRLQEHGVINMVGSSKPIQDVYNKILVASGVDSIVLITGETGTGKELVARAIHEMSSRNQQQFIAINCAAIPQGLFESQMFGHIRGSFTGAISNYQGFFKQADHGTLFLDEIAEMPMETQAQLLRVLQDGCFFPVGGSRLVKVDVRVMAATNQDLSRLVRDKSFRTDLYYRIKILEIATPPLRHRKDDIIDLIYHFINNFNHRFSRNIIGITHGLMRKLLEYHWPGNVRELEHVIEYGVLFSKNELIDLSDIPDTLFQQEPMDMMARAHGAVTAVLPDTGMEKCLSGKSVTRRRERVIKALDQTDWHIKQAAAILGINRVTLWRWMTQLGIRLE